MSTVAPIDVKRKAFKAFATYMGYFGAKYVGNDIQVLCGNIFDHAIVKSFTLFCIMFQATDNLRIALGMTAFLLTCQFIISLSPVCGKYVDKTFAKNVDSDGIVWPRNVDLDSLGRPLKQETATSSTSASTSTPTSTSTSPLTATAKAMAGAPRPWSGWH